MENQLATQTNLDSKAIETVLLDGDLSALSPAQRVSYYNAVCQSVGLNPLTRPFDYLKLNNKLVLYARKDATDQIRNTRHVSITKIEKQFSGDLYIVTAHAQLPDGRTDAATGVVTVGTLKGDGRANAVMKAETKAKRRVTLSICGLGILDETEVTTIQGAKFVEMTETGEITGESYAMTYEDARQIIIKTSTGDKFLGELSVEQLHSVIEKAKTQEHIDAAKIVLQHNFNME